MIGRIRWGVGWLLCGVFALACMGCGNRAVASAPPSPTPSPTALPLPPLVECAPDGMICAPAIARLNSAWQMQMPRQLPDVPQPAADFPLTMPQASNEIFISGNPINLLVTLANPTSTPETLQAVELRLVHFAPQAPTIPDAVAACDTRVFSKATGIVTDGACNLSDDPPITYGYPVKLMGNLPDGLVIPLQLGMTSEAQQSAGPVVITPYAPYGATTLLDIAISPQRAGIYQFQVGVMVQGDQLHFFAPIIAALAVLPEQVIRFWSADNCKLPEESGQVPPMGNYLCPGPVPGN